MKSRLVLVSVVAGTAVVFASGCGDKNDGSANTAVPAFKAPPVAPPAGGADKAKSGKPPPKVQ